MGKILMLEKHVDSLVHRNNAQKVKKYLDCVGNGQFLNQIGFWKLKRKMCLNQKKPPTAKRDANGNLISSNEGLKNLYLDI